MNSLTNMGEKAGVYTGGIANVAAKLRLYTSDSVPAKDGTGFVEAPDGNGYAAGGIAISLSDWTFSVVSGKGRVTLADKTWTASGGSISNVAGCYAVDASDNALAWWERPGTSAPAGQPITASGLFIG